MSEELKRKVESILFAAGRAVSMKELQSLLHINEPGLIKETIRELKEEYDTSNSSMIILSEGDDSFDAWKLTVREKFLPLVRRINPHTELSKTMLETLAVIAWKQPALQSDVVKIRTNKAYDHIAELCRLGFVVKERHGRSFLLKVTQKFLDYFDLPDDKSIKDVFKDFKDIETAVQKKGSAFSSASPEEQDKEQEREKNKEENDTNESAEIETYVDTLPPMEMPKKGVELETYVDAPEGIDGKNKTQTGSDEERTPATPAQAIKKEDTSEPEETPEEKARRIAEELIEKEMMADEGEVGGEGETSEEKEDEVKSKILRPELEEFIAGAENEITEKKNVTEEDRPENGEEEPAGEAEEKQTESEPEPSEPEQEEKPKPAEEYPGQFEEKDGGKEEEKGE